MNIDKLADYIYTNKVLNKVGTFLLNRTPNQIIYFTILSIIAWCIARYLIKNKKAVKRLIRELKSIEDYDWIDRSKMNE